MKGGYPTDMTIEVPVMNGDESTPDNFKAYTFHPLGGGTGFYVGLAPGPNKELWVGMKEEKDRKQKVTEVRVVPEGVFGDNTIPAGLGLSRGHPKRAKFLNSDKLQNDIIKTMELYNTEYPKGGNVPFLIFDNIFRYDFSSIFNDEDRKENEKLGYYLWIHDFHHKDGIRTIEYKIGDATKKAATRPKSQDEESIEPLSSKGGKRKTRRVKKSYRKSYRKPNRKRRSNTKRHTHKH